MKKRILCILMCLLLIAASFAGCKGSEQGPADPALPTKDATANEPAPTKAEADPTQAAIPEPTPEATPEPKPRGRTYEDGLVSPVAGAKENFDAESLKAGGLTVVDSVEDFLQAIRPGAHIVLAPGYYDLSICMEDMWNKAVYNNSADYDRQAGTLRVTDWVYLVECFDGAELMIKDVDDLMISGGSEDFVDTRIVVEPRYAAVLRFERCNDVQLFNLTAGHTDSGDCSGNVIDMLHCSKFRFHNMDIFGCGVYGLGLARGTGDVCVYNSTVRDCSYGSLEFREGTGDLTFVDCTLTGSPGLFFTATTESKLVFKHCTFGDGETTAVSFNDKVVLEDCTLGNIEYYPEYPDYEGGRFDPSGFKAGEMAPVTLDDDAIGEYSEWGGYTAIDIVAGTERKMPFYDLTKDQLISFGISFYMEGDQGKCWLSTGDNFWRCSWSRVITAPNVVIFNPEYDEDSEWLTENEGGAVFGYLYKDHSGHDWLCLELRNNNIWLYRNDEQEYYD